MISKWEEAFRDSHSGKLDTSKTIRLLYKNRYTLYLSCGVEVSNNVVCATSKASDQPVHMRSLIRAFASRLNIL